MKRELIATATFGLEAVVKREIQALGYEIIRSEDGKITFEGDEMAIARANLWLRCADRVLLKMGEFQALEFEELYQQTKGIPWEELIPMDGKFVVTGTSVKSKLFSVPSCQSIVKKAIVDRLADFYCVENLPETGSEYKVKVTILKDRVTLTVDTSGVGLHKRGYRIRDVHAPIKETLAAAMVRLSFWRPGRFLVDPCCGSGTIPIEAALIGRNIAPGLLRTFVSEEWDIMNRGQFEKAREEALSAVEKEGTLNILGRDVDRNAVAAARENAEKAGVSGDIRFVQGNISRLEAEEKSGIIITNPPYGERIGEEKEIAAIYRSLGGFCQENKDWSLFLVTTDKAAETKIMGRPANRRRKLYNGRLEVCYYQFHGEKPRLDKRQ
ncbi:MAG: THUMP domain-containing class I SAM-dependent RNA methyltransferase [Anaerovoracaceae bacterium]|jgi:putative N6-adenine-specific DNA methylase